MQGRAHAWACMALLCLAGCASPPAATPNASGQAGTPAQWYAPLPHNGQLTNLSQWWRSLDDPLLVELIEAAQAASPTVAGAASRIGQARAARAEAGAALGPTVDFTASASRGLTQPAAPLMSTVQGGLQASWELDLFGGRRAAADAAREREAGAQAQWHDARVSVASEVASQLVSLRSCAVQLDLTRQDAASRSETARLSALTTGAGLTAPAADALVRAAALEAANRVIQTRAQCDAGRKALVALTGLPEPEITQKMAAAPANRWQSATFSIATLPAQVVAQRPDVFQAERELVAASLDVDSTAALALPRVSLNGSIGAMGYSAGDVSQSLSTWSIGPLGVTLPLFDGGKRSASLAAAKARQEEAAALYRARVRQAVREVEEALVNLQSSQERAAGTRDAALAYRVALDGARNRYERGLGSLVELEELRRASLAAEGAALGLQRDHFLNWVALYRAAGGGWQRNDRP